MSMEYTKEYMHIQFRITYSVTGHVPNTISFAAEPFERLIDKKRNDDPNTYLLYGKVEIGEHLEVGFRPFTFAMDQDLHSRLGLLYEMVLNEYRRVVGKK